MENWKSIAGYEERYEVSNLGRVRSLNYNHTGRAKILKPGTNNCGYHYVTLCKDGNVKHMLVHRLVALAFVQNPLNLETVNHRNEDKHNNNVSNLEWLSRKDNNAYSRPQLAERSVQMFNKSTGELLATFPSVQEAGRQTGISDGNICLCCNGERKSAGGFVWRYL